MATSEDEDTKGSEPKPIAIEAHDAFQFQEATTVDIWTASTFAPDWFGDSVRESKAGLGNYNARRREILFSVAFAESYLVEWVRDEVLKKDYQHFSTYFPPGIKVNALDKFKEIPKKLCEDKLILRRPDWGKSYWEDYKKLVDYRDGLVHASSSRPESGSMSQDERPLPPASLLAQLQPAWAIGVVIELVKELHRVLGTPLPAWLTLS
jgi:hypothetical protein